MLFDKGVPTGSTCSILPKDLHSPFGPIQASTEGDASDLQPPVSAYRHRAHLQPPLDISDQPSSYYPRPAQQVYHLHFPQQSQSHFGGAYNPPLQYPYSTPRNSTLTIPPSPSVYPAYSDSTRKEDPDVRGTLSGHPYDLGYRVAPSALTISASQRTLVDTPRYTTLQSPETATSCRTVNQDLGKKSSDRAEESPHRSLGQIGKSMLPVDTFD